MHNKKTSKEVLIERAVKTTLYILYVTGIFDKYANVDEVLNDNLLIEVNGIRRPDLDSIISVIQ